MDFVPTSISIAFLLGVYLFDVDSMAVSTFGAQWIVLIGGTAHVIGSSRRSCARLHSGIEESNLGWDR
eukprot:2270483-Amphidinium_carterae.1